MTIAVTELFRHPIKGHGREALDSVTLEAGKTMPGDRVWAIANQMCKVAADKPEWAVPANWSRGSKCPGLMAINAKLDEETGTVLLSHFAQGEITVRPDDPADAQRLVDWTAPLMPEGQMTSHFVVRAPGRGMTDAPYPSISINTHNSLRALSQAAGTKLSPLRWRGNIWLEAEGPWQEFEWIGKTIRIGTVELAVREPILRCTATMANPDTGARDVDTLKTLRDTWDHQDFGVYAEVAKGGEIGIGDTAELI
ncbi:MAG: MOSC domain-containing protein [Rhodobacteraceae bacterium]|nr:MOSC domain-containing protein [Paracoccaceae bacterium]